MNLPLLDKPLAPFPQLIESTIPDTPVSAVYFNHQGTHLAGCCNNGVVLIWDVSTMTLLRLLHGHAAAVKCASWFKSGRYIATGGLDGQCLIWDIVTETILHSFQFDIAIIHLAFHPSDRSQLLVSLAQSLPILVNTSTKVTTTLSIPDQPTFILECLATWDGPGTHLWLGSIKGDWFVFSLSELQLKFKERFSASIRHFALSKSGHYLAMTLSDKTIRLFGLPYLPSQPFECVPILKCHDPINRQAWSSCAWTSNEAYFIGATIGHTHVFHIWSKETGTLVTLLEGPAEPILHFAWHPFLPYCVSVSHYGTLILWNTFQQEKWSAYEPGFQEIEDNIEYQEREDEFDIVTLPSEDEKEELKLHQKGERKIDTFEATETSSNIDNPHLSRLQTIKSSSGLTFTIDFKESKWIDLHTPIQVDLPFSLMERSTVHGDTFKEEQKESTMKENENEKRVKAEKDEEEEEEWVLTVPLDQPKLEIPKHTALVHQFQNSNEPELKKRKRLVV